LVPRGLAQESKEHLITGERQPEIKPES